MYITQLKMLNNKEDILVLDVCGTLFYENTTLGFIKFYTQRNSKIKFLIVLLLSGKFSPIFWLFRALEYFKLNKLIFKKIIIFLLRGERVDSIKSYAKLYIQFLFKYKKILNVWKYVDDYTKKQNNIILASSSIEPVVFEIAKKINAAHISSSLEIRNNKYTGKLLCDTVYCKASKLKLLGIDINQINIAISDNFEDLNLIRNAKLGIAIVNSLKKSIFWKSNKINKIEWV